MFGVFLFVAGLSITLSMVMIRSLGRNKPVADIFIDGNPLMIAAYTLFALGITLAAPFMLRSKAKNP